MVIVGKPNLFDQFLVEKSKKISLRFKNKSVSTYNEKFTLKKKQTLSRPRANNPSEMTQNVVFNQNKSRSLNKNVPIIIEKDSMLAEMNVELYDINNVEEFRSSNKPNKTNIQISTKKSKVHIVEKLQQNSNKIIQVKTKINKSNKQKEAAKSESQSFSNNAKKKNRKNFSSQNKGLGRFVIKKFY